MLPAPATLSAVFDHFVFDTSLRQDTLLMETAGAQCILMAGFFEDQSRRRHNIRWYAELGAAFFSRAAAGEPSPRKAQLLDTLARHFEQRRQRHARLGRDLEVIHGVLEGPCRVVPDLPYTFRCRWSHYPFTAAPSPIPSLCEDVA